MEGHGGRRKAGLLGGAFALAMLALPVAAPAPAQEPDEPGPGRHAMHLERLGGGRDMGMGMQAMRGRGMMMGRTMSGDQMMRGRTAGGMMRRMMGRPAERESDPRWCPSGMERGMCSGMTRQGAVGQEPAESEGGG